MMRILIFGPIVVFLFGCLVSLAIALGVDMTVVTDTLLVVVAIFAGAMIFLSSLGRQWRSAGIESRADGDESEEGQSVEPLAAGQESSAAQARPASCSDEVEQPCGAESDRPIAVCNQRPAVLQGGARLPE